MDEKKLRELIKSGGQSDATRSWRCPNENELAAYIEGQFTGVKRQRMEGHFANCNWCLEALAFLGQSSEQPAPDSVPGHLLTRARMLAPNEQVKGRRWSWTTAAAAVCVLIIAVFIVWRIRANRNPVPPVDLVAQNHAVPTPSVQPAISPEPSPRAVEALQKPKPTQTRPPMVRGEDGRIVPTILRPQEGGPISKKNQAFVWSAVADATFYEVKVVKNDGTPVFKESVSETRLALQSQSALQEGAQYFVTIEAHLSDGRVIRSKLVKFQVAP
jgi:hypothetical protein